MTFREYFYKPSAKGRWQSWWSLTICCPFVVGAILVAYDAVNFGAIATRQQAATALITGYRAENHGRYDYTFSLSGNKYIGQSSSPISTTAVGQRMDVYFDPRDPTVNSLEDFSSQSENNWHFLPYMLVPIPVIVGIIAFSKATKKGIWSRSIDFPSRKPD